MNSLLIDWSRWMIVVVLLRRRSLGLHRRIEHAAGGAHRGDSGQEYGIRGISNSESVPSWLVGVAGWLWLSYFVGGG